jgi:hypothetical protein
LNPPIHWSIPPATPLESTLVDVFILNSLNLFRINADLESPHFAQFWCNATPFRINTCKTVSKQTTLTSFRINTYEKTRGWGAPRFGNPSLATPRSPLHSSSFFSHPCALFCTAKNSSLFFSINSALFTQKHRGWGYPSALRALCPLRSLC